MGLSGRLSNGTYITPIPCCDFDSDRRDSLEPRSCGDDAHYRVFFPESDVVAYACEEHAQQLWDKDVETK